MRFWEYYQLIILFIWKYLKKLRWNENMNNIRDIQMNHNSQIIKLRYEIIINNIMRLLLNQFLIFFWVNIKWYYLLEFNLKNKNDIIISKNKMNEIL